MKLDHWETGWLERHDKHYDGGVIGRTLGTLNDYDPEEDSDKEEHLLSYCEESRPRGKKVKVVVRHASGDFVTVHDYLSTVHPWLMSLKGESEAAPNSLFEEFSIVDFMVRVVSLKSVSIHGRSHWIEQIERAASNAALQASAFTPPTIRNQTYPFFGPHPAPQPGQPQPPTQYLPLYG